MTCLAYRSGGERYIYRDVKLIQQMDGQTHRQSVWPLYLNLLANGLPDVINIIK